MNKAEVLAIVAEETEGVLVTGEAEKETQFPEDPRKSANCRNLERSFVNLIENWDFKVIAAWTAINVVNGREIAKIVSSVKVLNKLEETALFYTGRG